jgi:hypothetical protein
MEVTRRMVLTGQLLVLFSLTAFSIAATRDPFLVGYSMGDNGAVTQANGPSGRQPWIPACFYADTFQFGVSVCGIDYYDAMDNLESSHIVQVVSGAWYARHRLILKASYSFFNALGLYNEQQGFLSMGFKVANAISASIDVTANRAGLPDESSQRVQFLNAGASLFVSAGFAALSISCSHFPIKKALTQGVEPPVSVDIGLHTIPHRFGAQGVVCEITKESDYAFRFTLGESYFVNDCIALCGALSTSPFMMHFGLVISGDGRGIGLSFVNHPVLGWSKGLTVDYAHR